MGSFRTRSDFLPLSRPSFGEDVFDAIRETLDSGWITAGPRTQEFETAFATYTGAKHALALTSATAGLHLGMLALGVERGDEVITPSLTWASAVNVIELLGARPVFVDIEPRTLQIDPAGVARAITARTVGILPVHFAGAPYNVEAIESLAAGHGLWIFEDAAHAVGTRFGDEHVANGRQLGVYSFHPIKNMTTIEGGMLTTNDDALAARLRRLRFHGLEKSTWDRYAGNGRPQVDISEPGFKYNFTDVQAAIGLKQLASVEIFNQRRRALAALYDHLLEDLPEIETPAVPEYDHVHAWHLYVIKVRKSRRLDRDRLIVSLKNRHVGTGIHFRAIHTQPYYQTAYPNWRGALPHTEWASDRICSLPLFPQMTDEDVAYVAAAIQDATRST